MISTIHQEAHSIRRRMFADVFSRSKIWASHSLRSAVTLILYERFLPIIGSAASSGDEIDIHSLTCAYSIDLLQSYQFGMSIASNLIQNIEQRETYLSQYFTRIPYMFWISEFPLLVSFSSWIGIDIVPQSVTKMRRGIEDSMLKTCDDAAELILKRETLTPEDTPVVYSQEYIAFHEADHTAAGGEALFASGNNPARHRLEIASDMLDFNAAMLETSGDAIIWIYFQLSLHPESQVKLREELLTLKPALKFPSKAKPELPDPKAVDDLPFLHAIVLETLRLYPASDGGQRRITPSPSCYLAGHKLPPGVVVQASVYCRHHNPDIFPDHEKWEPQRWMNASPEKLLEMKRWFWAFGSGSMMCIGKNFAMYCKSCPETRALADRNEAMKYAIAAIYTNFASECMNPKVRMPIDKQKGSSIGARHELRLRFTSVRNSESTEI